MTDDNARIMHGKTVLVTGASSGIGEATAARIAAMGAHVVMVSRTARRGEKARDRIRRAHPGASLDLLVADLSTGAAVRALAGDFRARYSRLDVLVNNAGLITSRRRTTPDGLEMQFAVNHLAYFLLTGLLLDVLRATAPARVVNVASSAQSSGVIDFDDLQMQRHYRGWQMYANTKLMNVMFTYALAARLERAGCNGVTANCLHPGVIHTGLMRNFSSVIHLLWMALGRWFKQPDDGAETPAYLASSPDVAAVSGRYFRYCRPMDTIAASRDPAAQERLWSESERFTGFRYPL